MFSPEELLHEIMREVEYINLLATKKDIREDLNLIKISTAKIKYFYSNFMINEKLSCNKFKADSVTFNLADLVKETLSELKIIFSNLKRELSLNVEADTVISADPLLTKILISNLIENALKHSKSKIHLRIFEDRSNPVFEISNDIEQTNKNNSTIHQGQSIIQKIVDFLGLHSERTLISTNCTVRLKFVQ